MRVARRRVMVALVSAIALTACGGTTGGGATTWNATTVGVVDAGDGSLAFTNDLQASVVLTRAQLYVGAVYFNSAAPDEVDRESCISADDYVGQVMGGFNVDVLSAHAQPFPMQGEGIEDPAQSAAIWLTSGDVNAADDPAVIFDVAGAATQSGVTYPFTGTVTIGENRVIPPEQGLPGAHPICLQRIVAPIAADFVLRNGGTLELQIDVRAIFADVDFSALVPSADDPSQYVIPDTNEGIGGDVFQGLHRDTGVYTFTYVDANGD